MRTIKVYTETLATVPEDRDIDEDDFETDGPEEIGIDDPDEDDIEEHGSVEAAVAAAVRDAIRSCVEPSCSSPRPGTWYTDADDSRDYRTGETSRRSYHLDGFDHDDEVAVYALLTGAAPR